VGMRRPAMSGHASLVAPDVAALIVRKFVVHTLADRESFPMPQEANRSAPNRSARLEARISPEVLAVVRRAAELQGRSVSDFVVAAAHEAANRTIEETHIIRLSVEDQRAFADAILNPPPPSPALLRAAEAHARLIRKR